MTTELARSTVYFDGACPLCRTEIDYYRRRDHTGTLCFVDVSVPSTATPADLDRVFALQRLHVRAEDGRLVSGAAAFVEVWRRLPGWRIAARIAALPGVLGLLEMGYRLFLRVRPGISRLFGRILARRAARYGAGLE
jgi:predicted DCC family thiol-disulfide oxidoreductase YuxK